MSRLSTFKKLVDLDIPAKEIEVLGERVHIKQHIPTIVQQRFIREVVHTSFLDGGKFSPLLFEVSLGIGLALMYTDINFSKRELEKPLDTYDVLEGAGVIKAIVDNIPEQDFAILMDLVNETIEVEKTQRSSIKGLLADVLEVVPLISEAMEQGLEGVDVDLLKEAVEGASKLQNQ